MILQVVKIQESWWLLLREKQPPLSSISVSRSIWQMKTLRVWQGQKRQEATVRCSSQGLVGPKSSFPKKNCTEHNVLHSSSKYIFDMSFWKYSSLSHRSCLVAGCTASMVLFTKKKKRKDLSNCDTSLTWMTQRSRLDTSFQWCNGVTSGLDQLSSPETIWSGTWLWAQTSKKRSSESSQDIFFSCPWTWIGDSWSICQWHHTTPIAIFRRDLCDGPIAPTRSRHCFNSETGQGPVKRWRFFVSCEFVDQHNQLATHQFGLRFGTSWFWKLKKVGIFTYICIHIYIYIIYTVLGSNRNQDGLLVS